MEPNELKYRAKLDADSIYWGVEEVAELEVGDVEVPRDCDLKPGHYRHDGEKFIPLERHQRRDSQNAPMTERALYELLLSMKRAGNPVPAYCDEWARYYEQTMDARGALQERPYADAVKGGA